MKFFKRKKEADAQPVAPQIAPADSGPAADDARPAAIPAATADSHSPDAVKQGFFSRLRRGLGRTSENLLQGMGTLFLGRKEIDESLLEQLESRLLLADDLGSIGFGHGKGAGKGSDKGLCFRTAQDILPHRRRLRQIGG